MALSTSTVGPRAWALGLAALAWSWVACGEVFSSAGGDGGATSGTAGMGAGAAGGTATTSTSSSTPTGSDGGSSTTPPNDGGPDGGEGGGGSWGDAVEVAQDQPGPWGITVDPSNLYWANEGSGTIVAMPLPTGAPAVRSNTGGGPRGIADWAGYLAWADPVADQGCRFVVSTSATSCVGPVGGDPEDVALGSQLTAYFTAPGVGAVESWDGSMNSEIASGQADPQGIDVDAVYVYWANAGSSNIMRSPIAGPQPTEFAATSGPPQHVESGALGVFWTVPDLGLVEGRDLEGEPVTLASNEGQPWDIASDGVRVYWTNRSTGEVRSARPDGTGLRTIADGLDEPIGITVGSSAVYWTDHAAGKIWKADLPR